MPFPAGWEQILLCCRWKYHTLSEIKWKYVPNSYFLSSFPHILILSPLLVLLDLSVHALSCISSIMNGKAWQTSIVIVIHKSGLWCILKNYMGYAGLSSLILKLLNRQATPTLQWSCWVLTLKNSIISASSLPSEHFGLPQIYIQYNPFYETKLNTFFVALNYTSFVGAKIHMLCFKNQYFQLVVFCPITFEGSLWNIYCLTMFH